MTVFPSGSDTVQWAVHLALIAVVLVGCRRDDSFQELDRGMQKKRFRRNIESDLERVRKATRHQLDQIRKRLETYEERVAKLQVRHKRLDDRVASLQTKLREQLLVSKEAGAAPTGTGVINEDPGEITTASTTDMEKADSNGRQEASRDDSDGDSTTRGDRIWALLARSNLDVSALADRIREDVEPVSDRIVRGLFDTSETRRRNAEKLILEVGPGPFRERLLELLRSSRYTLRLIQVVGRLHISAARDRLRELKQKKDPDTKYYATRALVQVGDPAAVEDLIDYLSGEDGDPLYRMDAHLVLKQVMNRDFGHPSAAVASRRENRRKEVDWRNWWNAYRDNMTWNPDLQRYAMNPGTASPVTVQPHHGD